MIINNLDGMRVAIPPEKTDSELIIHSNAMLPLAAAVQRF